MRNLEYRIFHGSYQLIETDAQTGKPTADGFGNVAVLHQCDELAIVIDKENGTVHKHGSATRVEKWHKEATARTAKAGLQAWAKNLVMVSSSRWNPEQVKDFNHALACTGYGKRFLENLGLLSATQARLGGANM